MTMTGGDWHDSLFKDEKGDSLGDGTWGKPDPNEGKLAPVAWDKLPEAPDPNKKIRARLATPAPGSQKESGLLDIKALAPSLTAGMRNDDAGLARGRQPTPPPPATTGGASEPLAAKEKAIDPVAEAAIEAMKSSASISGASFGSPRSQPPIPDEVDDVDATPNRGRSMIVAMLAVLTIAVLALAYYVLTAV
jgi:hypothetical protein